MLLAARDEDKLEEGRREGLEEGRREGRQQGLREGRTEIVEKMYDDNLSMEQISSLTGIPLEEVKDILNINSYK